MPQPVPLPESRLDLASTAGDRSVFDLHRVSRGGMVFFISSPDESESFPHDSGRSGILKTLWTFCGPPEQRAIMRVS